MKWDNFDGVWDKRRKVKLNIGNECIRPWRAEGVLYYGGQGAGGLKSSDYITELTTKSDYQQFLESCAPPQVRTREDPGVTYMVELP